MKYDTGFKIGDREISNISPTYFVADLGANHDGSLERAKDLIRLAKDAGADCAKFQHFRAKDIVSAEGFRDMKVGHQTNWERSVYEVYEQYSLNREWNEVLAETAKEADIDFMTTPYDFNAVESINDLVEAFKIGSGDITYHQLIVAIASMGKPVFLATGASTMGEVEAAVGVVLATNPKLCLLQCNTNYTGNMENFNYVNLNVLRSYALHWPGLPLGLSDHTPGHSAVLGGVALGARVIEKHFTDDHTRKGPDHSFAMEPMSWALMRMAVRQLEDALGDGVKRVEENEVEAAIVQQRCIRAKMNLTKGVTIEANDIEFLRPAPTGSMPPYLANRIIGGRATHDIKQGSEIQRSDSVHD